MGREVVRSAGLYSDRSVMQNGWCCGSSDGGEKGEVVVKVVMDCCKRGQKYVCVQLGVDGYLMSVVMVVKWWWWLVWWW